MSQFPPGPPPNPTFDSPVLQNYPTKPTSVVVMSIIVLVFYGGSLLCAPFSLLALFVAQPPNQPKNVVLELLHNSTSYRAYVIASLVVGLAVSIVYVGGAITSLRGKAIGRRLMVWASVATLILALINLGATIFLVMPPLMSAIRSTSDAAVKFGATAGLVGALVGPFVSVILPGLILYFFRTPNVVDYFGPRQTQSWNTI